MPATMLSTRGLSAHPPSCFSRDLVVSDVDGAFELLLQRSFFGVRAEFRLGGHSYTIVRESIWGQRYVLKGAGRTVVALRRSIFTRDYEIQAGAGELELVGRIWSWSYELRLAGETIGQFRPRGFLGRRCEASFSTELPVELALFAMVLAYSSWEMRRSR